MQTSTRTECLMTHLNCLFIHAMASCIVLGINIGQPSSCLPFGDVRCLIIFKEHISLWTGRKKSMNRKWYCSMNRSTRPNIHGRPELGTKLHEAAPLPLEQRKKRKRKIFFFLSTDDVRFRFSGIVSVSPITGHCFSGSLTSSGPIGRLDKKRRIN